MLKSRFLPFSLGDRDNGSKRYATTGIQLPATAAALHWDDVDTRIDLFEEARLRASTPYVYTGVKYTGHEKFMSTERQRPHFNNCEHSRSGGFCLPFSELHTYRDRIYYAFYNRAGASTVVEAEVDKHPLIDLSSAQRAAWNIMQPRFEGDISMFNFIIELKDFKSLGRALTSHPLKKIRNYFRRISRKGYIDVTKPIAELHLANEFALKPLLSDIVTIVSQMNELVEEAQKAYSDAGLGRNSRHYKEYFPFSSVTSWSEYYATKYWWLFAGHVIDTTFTATMEFSYQYSARSPIDAFKRYWGLTPTPEAVWNALPFSFLIDYFYKVGDALGAMERDKNTTLQLTQYCESLLSRYGSGVAIRPQLQYGGFAIVDGKAVDGEAPVFYSGYESTYYTRKVTSPNKGAVLPRITLPSDSQRRNLVALARTFL